MRELSRDRPTVSTSSRTHPSLDFCEDPITLLGLLFLLDSPSPLLKVHLYFYGPPPLSIQGGWGSGGSSLSILVKPPRILKK